MPDSAFGFDPETAYPATGGGVGSLAPGGTQPPAQAGAPSPLANQSALGPDQQVTVDMWLAKNKAEEPKRQEILKLLNEPATAKPYLEKVKEEPNPQDYQKYASEFAGAMAVLGAVAGRWTRNAGNASLNAFAGALKGWQQGNLQAYTDATKQWEQATKKTIENNKAELERYHEIINDKNANIDQMMAALHLAGTEAQNSVIVGFAKQGNYTAAFQAIDAMERQQGKVKSSLEQYTGIKNKSDEMLAAEVNDVNNNPDSASHMSVKDFQSLKAASEVMHQHNPSFPLLKAQAPLSGLPPGWTDASLNYQADLYNQTGQVPSFGFGGAAAQIRTAIINRAAERAMEAGTQPGEIVAGRAEIKALTTTLAQLEKQKAAVDAFENTAKANGRVLQQLADKVDRTGSPVIERWERAGRREIAGDVDVNNFNAQIQLYRNEVAKILSNPNMTGVLSDTARREAGEFLQGNATAPMIHGLVPLLNADMDRRQNALTDEINTVRGRMKGGGTAPAQVGAPQPAGPGGTTSSGVQWRIDPGPRSEIQGGSTMSDVAPIGGAGSKLAMSSPFEIERESPYAEGEKLGGRAGYPSAGPGKATPIHSNELSAAEARRYQRRIENADSDQELMKIQKELEGRGIDTTIIPAFQGLQ